MIYKVSVIILTTIIYSFTVKPAHATRGPGDPGERICLDSAGLILPNIE